MPREKRDLIKATMNVERETVETLKQFYPQIGWTVAARKILAVAAKRLREKESQNGTNGNLS